MTSWAGSTALITGAAMGMGREMAERAVAAGGRVVAWDVDADGLASLESEGRGRVATFVVDVTDREAVAAAAAESGPVDILVNNAGIADGARLVDADPDALEQVMSVNALSLFWTTRAFLPEMVQRNAGHVVTIASAAGLVPLRSAVAYTASKHAAVGFHDALRQELRVDAPQVRTTLVTPFFVDTGMFDGVVSRFTFLLPIVEQDDAVTRIVQAVERDRARLVMPGMAALAYALRIMPPRLGDVLLDQLGISSSMDHYVGRARRSS